MSVCVIGPKGSAVSVETREDGDDLFLIHLEDIAGGEKGATLTRLNLEYLVTGIVDILNGEI